MTDKIVSPPEIEAIVLGDHLGHHPNDDVCIYCDGALGLDPNDVEDRMLLVFCETKAQRDALLAEAIERRGAFADYAPNVVPAVRRVDDAYPSAERQRQAARPLIVEGVKTARRQR